jgi:hypothetical protein
MMLSTAATTSMRLATRGLLSKQIRLISSATGSGPSLSKKDGEDKQKQTNAVNSRFFHKSAHKKQADAVSAADAMPAYDKKEKTATAAAGGLAQRFKITAEVTVSKIFPAGFGWQSASVFADTALQLPADSMAFALTTGVGDGVGVLVGHTLFYGAKKAITGNESINMTQEAQTGLWLGSAAFCSGTAWQPLVNALQGANLSFAEVFAGTWLGCGAAFYVGLRLGRTFMHAPMTHIEEPTYENSKNDACLSAVIGGATGFFVGTDAAYLPEQNFLINLVGIQDGTHALVGCAIAGTSTGLGFIASQSTLNMIYPAGECWND